MWIIFPAVFAWLAGVVLTSWATYRFESHPEPIAMKEFREPTGCKSPSLHSGRYGEHYDGCYEINVRPEHNNRDVFWWAFGTSFLWPLWLPFWFAWFIGHKISGG